MFAAGDKTSQLVSDVSDATAQWDTWFNRATAAQRTIDEMSSQAEMTSSRARDMLDILTDFDARAQGSRSLRVDSALPPRRHIWDVVFHVSLEEWEY